MSLKFKELIQSNIASIVFSRFDIMQDNYFRNRFFRSNSLAICEEWVSAISSAIKAHNQAIHDGEDGTPVTKKPLGRRATLSNIRSIFDSKDDEDLGEENDKNELSQPEVTVTLVALKSLSKRSEIVLTRSVLWDATVPRYVRIVIITDFYFYL